MTAESLNSTREKTDEVQIDEVAACPSRRRIGIEKLGRTSHVTFHSNGPETRQELLSKPHVEAKRKGHPFDCSVPISLSPPFAPLCYIFFNGLCRKSMWDRLHSGRKRVWSSTNKHYGQTAAGSQSRDLSKSAHTHFVFLQKVLS